MSVYYVITGSIFETLVPKLHQGWPCSILAK